MLVPTHLDTTHYFTWWQLLKLHYTNHPSASCQGLTWLPSARQAPFHTMVHHCKLLWWHPAQLNVHCVVPGISWVSNLGFLSNQPWTGSQHPCAPSIHPKGSHFPRCHQDANAVQASILSYSEHRGTRFVPLALMYVRTIHHLSCIRFKMGAASGWPISKPCLIRMRGC